MTVTPPVFPPSPPIPQATGPVKLLLPPTEDREHRYFTLDNGLEVVVVSDPNADKAAASMDVGVGHLSDPDDLPGCAHFCEHLMFLGTKKYPAENDYSVYLSSHNGGSNAWTAMTSTNYYFDVAPDALEGALDRFAGFFIEPLFAEDCTEREINAVNSEHKKNLQSDMWRFFQLEKSLSKSGHPYGKFGTGNLESLWTKPQEAGRDPRKQLIEWWEKEYCARRMKLAVAGRDDLDTLERLVRERFANVPIRTEGKPLTGRDGVRVTFDEHPYGPEQQGVVTFVKPVRDVRALEINFPLPDLHHKHEVKPYNFVGHFIGHEGKGSLLSYLKQKGWANSLSAGNSHEASGFSFFKISLELTPEGLEHWKDVALAVFKYISLLRSVAPSETAFDEMRKLSQIGFKFAERGKTRNYVTQLSGWLQAPVPRDQIVSSNYLLGDWDESLVSSVYSLFDPRSAVLGVTSQELPKNVPASFDKKETIYGTQYHQEKLDDAFYKEAIAGAPIKGLGLPGPNLFVPEKLDVVRQDVKQPALRPELLRDSEVSRLWYKKDDRFWLPKTNMHVELQSPLLYVSPRTAVLGRLLCDLFVDATTEDVYDASLADLTFDLYYTGDSISISAGGYTDKLALMTETMLNKFVDFEIDPIRFEKVVDQVKLHWRNFELSTPYSLASYWASYVRGQGQWTQKEKLKEIDFVTPADVKAFASELFQRLYVESLVHGNTTAEEAKGLQDAFEKILKPRALAPGEKVGLRQLLLPPASEHFWQIPVSNPAEVNNCVIHYTQVGESTDPVARARLALLAQIASEPAFNVLRTKEQLGYICQSSQTGNPSTLGFQVLVQSERDPIYVETRIEAFLEGLKATIEGTSDEEFERHRKSLIEKKEESPKNLGEESRRFWNRIVDGHYEFSRRQTDVEHLKNVTKAEVLELFMTTVHPSSATRRKFSTHMVSQHKGDVVKFDVASGPAVLAAFGKHNVDVDQAAAGALLQTSPSLAAVKEFVNKAIDGAVGLSAEATTELRAVADNLKGVEPAATAEVKLKDGNVEVKDISAFKAGLTPSKAALPVEPLVVSKL
ncbi:metalloprotease [Vanrija albida]|uniref:Metalloprotease n=1 Tax=Vanrija albida TaxID=181172 RepID=A0ABR3QDS9_9TREE